MTRKKKMAVIFALLTAVLLAAALLVFGENAGADFFRSSLEKAAASFPGWRLEADSYSGNPFLGFAARNVRVSYKGEMLARADSLSLSLSLFSLLKGSSGIEKISVSNASLSSAELLAAIRDTDLPPDPGGMSPGLPVIILAPSRISTPMGILRADILRLTPGRDTVTFEGKGSLLGTKVEIGGSLGSEGQIITADSFLRAGDAAAALSGEIFPDFFLEGAVENLDLEKATALLSLPISIKGVVNSSIAVSRPGGKLLVSGEGEITRGDIEGLLTEGAFMWSADEDKATLSPDGGRVFSSPAAGSLSVFFGPVPLAEIKLSLENVDMEEWTSFFSWLSFGKGRLSSLKADLGGPLDRLSGPVSFKSEKAVLEGFPVTGLAGRLTVADGNRMDLEASGKWLETPFTATAKVTVDEEKRTETLLAIKSEKLDLKSAGGAFAPGLKLSGAGTGSLDVKYPFSGSFSLSGSLSVPKLSVADKNAGKLSAAFTMEGEILKIGSASLSLPGGGTLTAKGSLSGLSGNRPVMAFEGEGKSIPWAFIESLALTSPSPGLSGSADLRWSANSPLAAPSVEFDLRSGGEAPLSANLPVKAIVLRGRLSAGELAVSEGSGAIWGGNIRLSGKASLGAEKPVLDFKGSFSGVSLSEIAGNMGMPGASSSGSLSGEFAISGKEPQSLSLSVRGTDLSAGGVTVKGLTAKAGGAFPRLGLTSFSARILNSELTAEGWIELKKKGKMELSASVTELDLRELTSALFPGAGLGGKINGKAVLKGSMGEALSMNFSGTSPLITLHGLLAEKVKFSFSPDGKGGYSLAAEGKAGESILAAEGRLAFTGRGVEVFLKNSRKIDLGATAAGLSAQAAGIFSGEADFTAAGVFDGKSSLWEGRVTSRKLGFYRSEVENVDLPFAWKEGRITVSRGEADYHGGRAVFSGSADTGAMRWEGELSVKDMDLAKATEKMLGGRGLITGKADLTVKGSGSGGMVGMVFGSGRLSAREGSVSGFDALKTVSDTGAVNFSSVLASFNLDGRNIFLLPGSRVSAPVGDRIYRYFTASGSLGWNDSPLDLKCGGDINVRALNAFLGALQGIISVDGNPLTDPAFLQKFLTGLLGGMSVKDFRETSFNLKGSWDSPVLTDLKVTSAAAPASVPKPNGQGKNETQIKITVEIPTGEGKDTTSSTEDQFKKQILENIMKQIIRPGGEDGPTDH